MKKFLILIFATISISLFARSYEQEFYKLLTDKETAAADSILSIWKKSNPKDPELYPAEFNYFINSARSTRLVLSDNPDDGDYKLTFADSTGNVKGSLFQETVWDDSLFQHGIKAIEKGISLYPDRLDFRLGKAMALNYRGQWDEVCNTMYSIFERSAKNKYKWTGANGEAYTQDCRDIIANASFDHLHEMINDEDNPSVKNLELEFTAAILKQFPKEYRVINIAAGRAYADQDYHLAMKYFKKAHSIAPDDGIILANMVFLSRKMSDNKLAIKYCNEIINNPRIEEEWKDEARQTLKELSAD